VLAALFAASDDEAGGLRALHSLARDGAEALDEVAVLAAIGPTVAAAASAASPPLAPTPATTPAPSPVLAAPRVRISVATPGAPSLLLLALGGASRATLLLKQEEGAAPPAALLRDFALLGDAGGGGALASMAVLADELRERRVDLSLA
jgi:hypothetical protein